VRGVLTSLSVSGTNSRLVRLITSRPKPSRDGREPEDDARSDSSAFHEIVGPQVEEEADVNGPAGPLGLFDRVHAWEDMGSIRSVSVFQAPVPPSSSDDEKKQPIIVMSDCVRLIITEKTR
jgi:hypothetical protein